MGLDLSRAKCWGKKRRVKSSAHTLFESGHPLGDGNFLLAQGPSNPGRNVANTTPERFEGNPKQQLRGNVLPALMSMNPRSASLDRCKSESCQILRWRACEPHSDLDLG